jgi:hypothetical protein
MSARFQAVAQGNKDSNQVLVVGELARWSRSWEDELDINVQQMQRGLSRPR